jgi:hypothetical protein
MAMLILSESGAGGGGDDDGYPRMVTLFRKDREIAAIGAADGEDAARQAAIMVLLQEEGLKVGDVLQVTRI